MDLPSWKLGVNIVNGCDFVPQQCLSWSIWEKTRGAQEVKWNYISQAVQTRHFHTVCSLEPCEETQVRVGKPECHAGLDECFQPWVMLWDCTWEGLGWIKPPRQKTAEPETSRLLVSSQIHIHTWTDGNTRSLGRWRKTWWNMPGGLRMCIHRTTDWIHNKSHCFHVLSPCERVTLGKRVISS